MKDMFQKIFIVMVNALTSKQKVQKVMTEIGGGWYMGKITKGKPPLIIPKLSKKSQDKEDKILNISIGS